jgi:hypothetical protein
VRQAADELLKLRASQRYGTYRLLVVTDGEATDAQLLAEILPDVVSRGLVMDVIGVSMSGEHSLAKRAHSYRRADDESSLQQSISEVFAETSGQDQDVTADFDMLAGIPDELAAESLKALARAGNEPIRTNLTTIESEVPGPNAVPGASNSGATIASAFLGALCCIGTFGGLVFGVFLLVFIASKRRGR